MNFLFILAFCLFLDSCRSRKNVVKNGGNVTSEQALIQKKYGTLLGVESNSIKNFELYSFVDSWFGAPYKYGGKTKDGIDCSNFTSQLIAVVFNKSVNPPAQKIFEACKSTEKDQVSEGDLVFFKIESDKISHVGIFLVNNKFVHASTKKGVIISDLSEAYYNKYFFAFGKLKT